MRKALVGNLTLVLLLTAAVFAGGWLAAHRLFQVDEVQTMHMAWLLNQKDAGSYMNSAELYMLPMSFLSCRFRAPFAYMVACRFVFLAVFLAGLLILARAVAGTERRRLSGALALLLTTPILWDYGFEVRHDNIVILGLALLISLMFRLKPGGGVRLLSWGGVIGCILLLSSFKSVLLWGPILGYLAVEEIARKRISFIRATSAIAAGFFTAGFVSLAGHTLLGSLKLYLAALRYNIALLGSGSFRFFDWAYTGRFVRNHPWLLVASLVFIITATVPVFRSFLSRKQFVQDDTLPKRYFLLMLGIVFLAVNPSPFPYNYMYIAVLAFPAVFHVTEKAFSLRRIRPEIVAVVLIFLHAYPGVSQTLRHFYFRNDHQGQVVALLNEFTGPQDCVFDGAGLAMFRKGPGYIWYLHSLNKANYQAGQLPYVRVMLKDNPCPLLVKSYKWNFMAPEDTAFIKSRYIPFYMSIWVLGSRISVEKPGEYAYEIYRDGYYSVSSRTKPGIGAVRVDGVPIGTATIFLKAGSHILDVAGAPRTLYVLWGKEGRPILPAIPRLTAPVFLNWY